MTKMTVLHLLIAYAICFGIQNKLTFLYGRVAVLDKLLSCTYCLGFHCGWMVWLLHYGITEEFPAPGANGIVLSLVGWSLASAAFCYVMDAGVRWLEGSTPSED